MVDNGEGLLNFLWRIILMKRTQTRIATALAALMLIAVPMANAQTPAILVAPHSDSSQSRVQGTANQVFGLNSAGTAVEAKTVGGLGLSVVTHTANTVTITGRTTLNVVLTPTATAAVDGTTYEATLFPGRACIVRKVTFGAVTAPAGDTNTLTVKHASSSGNTMLSTASVSANTLTSGTALAGTLTSTLADRTLTAAQGVHVSYAQGTATTDAKAVTVTVEVEPTDAN